MANINVFKQFPDCIATRVKLRGILADCFPTEKVKINLILNAYDEGIDNMAVFVSDTWEFAPTWTLNAGIRYDDHIKGICRAYYGSP